MGGTCTLEEAKGESAAVKDEIVMIEREIGENFEEDLMNIYQEIVKNPGHKRAVLLIKTPFGFSLKIDTNLRCSL